MLEIWLYVIGKVTHFRRYTPYSAEKSLLGIGHDKVHQRRKWFSPKYYASVMNLKESFADALNDQSFCQLLIR